MPNRIPEHCSMVRWQCQEYGCEFCQKECARSCWMQKLHSKRSRITRFGGVGGMFGAEARSCWNFRIFTPLLTVSHTQSIATLDGTAVSSFVVRQNTYIRPHVALLLSRNLPASKVEPSRERLEVDVAYKKCSALLLGWCSSP